MVLLDQIVQVFGRTQFRQCGESALLLKFANRTMGSGITVQRNGLGRAALGAYGLAKEGLGRGDVAPRAEPEVNGFSFRVDSPVEINPLAADPDIGLVNAPRRACLGCKRLQRLSNSGV